MRSFFTRERIASTVVTVVRAARFIDSDGLAGRFSALSALPQYLTNAMFGFATAVALPMPRLSSDACGL